MTSESKFKILFASDPDYEHLVAEIYFEEKFVALINQEAGAGKFELETPGIDLVENLVIRKVELEGFLKAVDRACKGLRGEGTSSNG